LIHNEAEVLNITRINVCQPPFNHKAMPRKALLSFLLLTLLCGCHKEDEKNESVFRGLVIDYDTGNPKPGVTVILNRFDGLVIGFPDRYIGLVQDSALTDENGKYCFKVRENDKFLYKITTRQSGYLVKNPAQATLAKIIDYYPVNSDTIRTGIAGYVKLDVVNIPNDYDSVFINFINAVAEPYRLYPQLHDTTLINGFLCKDNPTVNVHWKITDKPESNTGSATVSLAPQDTVTVRIEF